MVLGTIPMAKKRNDGTAGTGRDRRTGGLDLATLLIVPAMFALVMGNSKKISPSIDPTIPPAYDTGEHAAEAIHGGPRPEEHPTIPGVL